MTEFDSYSRRPAGSGISLRAVLGTSLLAFVGGAALIGWLVYDDRLPIDAGFGRAEVAAPAPSASPLAALPSPSASPSLAAVAGGMDQRIAALEQRLTRLDLQAAATEGNTARAEALLVALATRRAIERGAPLGYLETQLKLRFGDAQANSVATLIANAQRPVTIDQLSSDLEALGPTLLGTPANEGGWQRFTRELSGLFVVRRGDAPSAQPDARLDRARLMLRSGQVETALAEVQRLPGASAAGDWVNAARRYAASQKALDLIETAALLEPEKLKNGTGVAVQQPGPGAPPAG
ncbi:COG4223 family protein [Novosphingobium ginsenosidimutans]|uniref:Inner membrane protein n=1 Tax=Novosphingobium ginsenosidimutans TaxID=1176536 RepID=A0A5B8S327_9SPHN|nr:mitofilin family membrane protein [Novosphingobium ginsenosidimutans]QEA15137.1 hypothetical protein FRF71_02730 [Novosphingobium ginsenosidimutans]